MRVYEVNTNLFSSYDGSGCRMIAMRGFVAYCYAAFGVTSADQAEATVMYLEQTAKKIRQVDRGKLRGAICNKEHEHAHLHPGSDPQHANRQREQPARGS